MAFTAYNATDNTQSLRDVTDKEIATNPTEETKIADWVSQPVGERGIGRTLYLRKIPRLSSNTYTSHASNGRLQNLTPNTAALEVVSATAVMKYSLVSLDRPLLNRTIEDGELRAGFRKQLMAAIREAEDAALFDLASSASASEAGAAIDDAMVRSAIGQLATNARGQFTEDAPKLLVVHPTQLKNVWNIPAIKEFQIRGSAGSAVNLKMNAYSLGWRESGLVKDSLGVKYNPLILKNAWALAHNELPHILDVQFDGVTENFVAVTEYAVCEWFDTSIVSLNIS